MVRASWMNGRIALALASVVAIGCGGEAAPKAERSVDKGKPTTTTKPAAAARSVAPTKARPDAVAAAPVPAPVELSPAKPEVQIPDDYRGAMRIGKELREQGELSLALTAFDRAADAAPRRAAPHVDAARVHITLGDIELARERVERAVELDSDSSAAWNTMGRVELAEGSLEAAAVSFERAGELNPDNSYAWNNLGFVRLEQKQYGDAVAALERATSGAIVTGYMWNNLGMAYEHLDRLDEARAAYGQGADAGSELAMSNGTRLEGVESIATPAAVAATDSTDANIADDPLVFEPLADIEADAGPAPSPGDVASTPVPVRE